MALPSSGPLSISQIRTELSANTGSLRSLSSMASKGTPDSISEFYGFNASNVAVYYNNDESSYGGDANLRIYVWDNNGTNILSEFWLWGTTSGNLASAAGITLKAGYRIQIYAYNWGASTMRLYAQNATTGGMLYDSCEWNGVGPYEFTLAPNTSYNVGCIGNYCTSVISYSQNTGQLYDGCSMSMDSYGQLEGTSANGNYIGPWGSSQTTNSERGNDAGTFLTFGGNGTATVRSGSAVTISAFSNGYGACPCQPIYSFINVNGGRVANTNTTCDWTGIYYTFYPSAHTNYSVEFGVWYGSV